jgi:hypothetical protein
MHIALQCRVGGVRLWFNRCIGHQQGNRVNRQAARFLTEVSEIPATKGH